MYDDAPRLRGEGWIARIADTLNKAPVLPPGRDHHDVGPRQRAAWGHRSRLTGRPPPPRTNRAASRLPSEPPPTFPTAARRPALRPTRHAGPGTSHIPPPAVCTSQCPSDSDPPCPRPHLPFPKKQRRRRPRGNGAGYPRLVIPFKESWGPSAGAGPAISQFSTLSPDP